MKNSTVINNEFTSHQTRTNHSNELSCKQSLQILWTSQPVQNLKGPDSVNIRLWKWFKWLMHIFSEQDSLHPKQWQCNRAFLRGRLGG